MEVAPVRVTKSWLIKRGSEFINGKKAYQIYVDKLLPVEGQKQLVELKSGQKLYVCLSEDGSQVKEVAIVG